MRPPILPLLVALAALGTLSSAGAAVRVNKGPVFVFRNHDRENDRVTQRGLLGQYVAWNAANEVQNIELRKALAPWVRALPEATFTLPHLELTGNYLAFGYKDANGVYQDWKFVETEFGYCHGMTMVTRNFAYFARFDGVLPAPAEFATEPKAWFEFYEKLVDRVMRNEPTVIPGFASLTEFSSSPIAEYLQRHVADQWALNTARVSAYRHVYEKNFKPFKTSGEIWALRERLAAFHDRGFYPRVVLGPGNYSLADPHVVMLTGVEPPLSANDNCIRFRYFNVGISSGGHLSSGSVYVGNYLWIPNDEAEYLADFMKKLVPPTRN